MSTLREWNADAYHRVSGPQTAWGERVAARVSLLGTERVLDIGCGTGRLTAMLLARLPRGYAVGLDRSLNMLTVAAAQLGPAYRGRVGFVQADALLLPFTHVADVVFSTATFHWVLDHGRLFGGIARALVPGGRLVAQCGGAGNLQRVHAHAAALASVPPFARYFTAWAAPWEFATPEVTRGRLAAAGFTDIATSLEAAPTAFADADAYAEFVRTVVLRPHLARLPTPDLQDAFVGAMTELAAADPQPFLLDYTRLNVAASRPADSPPA